jgi:hypothetical protein
MPSGGGSASDDNREAYASDVQYDKRNYDMPDEGGRDPTAQFQQIQPGIKTTVSDEARETLANQRTKATREISPMTDPKNKLIAYGLSTLVPGAGSLYGMYKTKTAMGYNQNMLEPFTNFFSGAPYTPPADTKGGDEFRDQMNQLAPAAPYVAGGQEAIPSVAQTNTLPSFDDAFQAARVKVNQQLGSPSNIGLLAVNESPFYDFLQIRGLNRRIL